MNLHLLHFWLQFITNITQMDKLNVSCTRFILCLCLKFMDLGIQAPDHHKTDSSKNLPFLPGNSKFFHSMPKHNFKYFPIATRMIPRYLKQQPELHSRNFDLACFRQGAFSGFLKNERVLKQGKLMTIIQLEKLPVNAT